MTSRDDKLHILRASHAVMLEALKDAERHLMGKARKDSAERAVVFGLTAAIAIAEDNAALVE